MRRYCVISSLSSPCLSKYAPASPIGTDCFGYPNRHERVSFPFPLAQEKVCLGVCCCFAATIIFERNRHGTSVRDSVACSSGNPLRRRYSNAFFSRAVLVRVARNNSSAGGAPVTARAFAYASVIRCDGKRCWTIHHCRRRPFNRACCADSTLSQPQHRRSFGLYDAPTLTRSDRSDCAAVTSFRDDTTSSPPQSSHMLKSLLVL